MTTDTPDRAAPLAGVRVLNLGTRWPGRVAAMLLADQGADVVEIVRPGRESHAVDPLLDRGKRLVELDLKNEAARSVCRDRAAEADVAIENMRPGAAAALGLDYAALGGERSGLVHISLPGFAEGDPMRDVPAWEGTVCAAVGVYSDISPLGALLGRPVYTAIPMASAYGGVLGSLAASLGLYRRQRTGRGQHIEVPLADCVMAAMALLTCKIEGQPARYNFPPIDNAVLDLVFPALRDLRGRMTEDHVAGIAEYVRGHANPTINFYECADGRILFVCAPDHVYQNRAFLQAIGVYDRVIAEGMVSETPYTEHDAGNNVNKAASLTPAWRKRLIGLIAQAVKTRPAAEWEATMRAANVPASMVRTSAEWLADPAVLEAGITADLDDPVRGPVRQPGRFLSIENAAVRSPGLRAGTPAAEDFAWLAPPMERPDPAGRGPDADADLPSRGMLEGVRVLDFSNIVAGPAAGRTLAEHGADVIRIDPPAPQAGPYATMWFGVDVNQGKRAAVLDLKSDAGKAALRGWSRARTSSCTTFSTGPPGPSASRTISLPRSTPPLSPPRSAAGREWRPAPGTTIRPSIPCSRRRPESWRGTATGRTSRSCTPSPPASTISPASRRRPASPRRCWPGSAGRAAAMSAPRSRWPRNWSSSPTWSPGTASVRARSRPASRRRAKAPNSASTRRPTAGPGSAAAPATPPGSP